MSSMKSLVIAEKPSVANLIADALSIDKKSKKAEFYENENFIFILETGRVNAFYPNREKILEKFAWIRDMIDELNNEAF